MLYLGFFLKKTYFCTFCKGTILVILKMDHCSDVKKAINK